jgi:hypothetical protein
MAKKQLQFVDSLRVEEVWKCQTTQLFWAEDITACCVTIDMELWEQ